MATFERAVLRSVRGRQLLAPGDRVVVAVSGGGDSTALLLVLDALARRHDQGYELLVAHLDHRLRGPESAGDAAFVESLATRIGREFLGGVAEPRDRRGNLEAWARAERARFLAEAARSFRATAICLGHTRDDQAETLLMRLARGAGPASLAAMSWRRADGVVRPLLDRSRAECAGYVAAQGWTPRQDSTNEDDRLLRNRVRRRAIPELSRQLGVDVVARLARLAEDLRVESRLADERIAELLAGAEAGLSVDVVRRAGPAARRLVHAWLTRRGVNATHAQVAGVVQISLAARPSARIDVPGGCAVVRRYERLEVVRAAGAPAEPLASVRWPVPGRVELGDWRLRASLDEEETAADGRWALRVAAEAVGESLEVRPPRPGDRVRLHGGTRKLSDVLIDARLPRDLRTRLAVVTMRCGRVLWIPGVAASAPPVPLKTGRQTAALMVERGLPDLL